MKIKFTINFALLFFSVQLFAQSINFDTYFEKKTLRFDFILAGDEKEQTAFVDGFREEPVWAGSMKNLIEKLDYGEYAVELYNKADNKLIYSTHLSTLFQEWRTTAEAKKVRKAFTNTAVMPFPKDNATLKLLAREKANGKFKVLLETEVDPTSIFIDRSKLADNLVRKIQYNGDPNKKVDLVFIAEGYTNDEQEKFFADVKFLSDSLFRSEEPFKSRVEDFNVWAVGLVSEDSRTDMSGKGIWKNTALNSGFWTFGLDRYLMTADYKSVRNAVWNVPCDAIVVLVNSNLYGGGGIYNYYSMVTSSNKAISIKVLAHELGHSLGGLADEYFESEVAYEGFYNLKVEPWEPNITTLVNFDRKWKGMLPKNTPIPTPALKSKPQKLGIFEGGGYLSKGIYRPADRCMMRDNSPFCPVCLQSLNKVIDYLTDK